MPSIAALKSESAVEVGLCHGQSSPQKRRLRSDAAAAAPSAAQGSPISLSTPIKWKSPRRCFNSSPNSVKHENGKVSSAILEMAVKDASANLTAKSNWNPGDVKQLSGAKEALHVSTAPSCIVCREIEQQRVFDFCKLCIQDEKPGSLYVCGCPGTGKSLSIEKVKVGLVDWAKEAGFEVPDILAINCTSFTKTSEIFSKIVEKTQPRKKLSGSTAPLQYLQNLYSQQQQSSGLKMMLIIADELDYLITKDRAVLHDLFMLTTFPFSRCIIIGIANAIDLADRFLPRLQSLNCKPLVVTFRAYSKDQILRILQERLMGLPYLVFHPQALELCARKVAAASGDMRKALCVCRSAIEILEAELRESTSNVDSLLQQNTAVASELFKLQENDIVRIDHMASALSKAYRSPLVDTIQSLPQHQQIILCSAVKFFRGGKKDTTLAELNKSYIEVCKSTMIPSVGILEFQSMCRVLNDQGLLKLGQGRDDKLRRVTLKVDEADISFALKGVRFFRNCLQ